MKQTQWPGDFDEFGRLSPSYSFVALRFRRRKQTDGHVRRKGQWISANA